MTTPKLYYAHPIVLYETNEESRAIGHIRVKFPDYEIVNPSSFENEEKDGGMDFYKKLVSDCDIVVFFKLSEKITAGVGVEVNHALSLGKSVYELREDGEFLTIKKTVKYLSRKDTRKLFDAWRIKRLRTMQKS